MQEHRLYRGQPKNKSLVPSALRSDCIRYMEEELSKFDINTQMYKQLCIPRIMPNQYCTCDKEAFYAYWLSLVNCAITVNKNPICLKFCQSNFFIKNKDKDNIGVYSLSNGRIAKECFNFAKFLFDSSEVIETLRLEYILHDYAFFQHFNHALSKLDKTINYKVHFPTLVLDWTWDYLTARSFAGEDGDILSISYEGYEKWNPTKNYQEAKLINKESRTIIFGLCTYRDTVTWNDNKYDWYSWDNNLMIEQQGAVIFWPWNYSIEELKNNDLGIALDFRLEEI